MAVAHGLSEKVPFLYNLIADVKLAAIRLWEKDLMSLSDLLECARLGEVSE